MLDIFVAFLGGERKSVANGFEAGVENSTCHFGHRLIGAIPAIHLLSVGTAVGSAFEKFLFGHGFLPPFASGKAPSL